MGHQGSGSVGMLCDQKSDVGSVRQRPWGYVRAEFSRQRSLWTCRPEGYPFPTEGRGRGQRGGPCMASDRQQGPDHVLLRLLIRPLNFIPNAYIMHRNMRPPRHQLPQNWGCSLVSQFLWFFSRGKVAKNGLEKSASNKTKLNTPNYGIARSLYRVWGSRVNDSPLSCVSPSHFSFIHY